MKTCGSTFLMILAALMASAAFAQAPTPALNLRSGSVSHNELVAIGRDLVVDGEAERDVVAISGSAHVGGLVDGDVIVLQGNVEILPGATIKGNVFVLGGHLTVDPTATVGGRAVSYPTVSAAWLTLIEGPSLGLPATATVVLGTKLALLAAWLLLAIFLFAVAGRDQMATSQTIRAQPVRLFFVGLTTILSLTLTAVLLSAVAAPLAGLPLLILVVLAALVLKLWGVVAVFHAVGAKLLGRFPRLRPNPVNSMLVGLLVLGSVKLIPWVGTWVWTAVSLIGVGAALVTKLGRREPWFGPEAIRLTVGD